MYRAASSFKAIIIKTGALMIECVPQCYHYYHEVESHFIVIPTLNKRLIFDSKKS